MQRALRSGAIVLAVLALLTAYGSYQGFGEPLFLFRLPFARPPAPLLAPGEVRRAGFADAVFTGKLADPSLVELSGLVASRRTPGVFFAIQDSGGEDRERLYALDAAGRSLGTWEIAGSTNYDWEDLAAFEHAGRAWIAIADIGDNQGSRDEVEVILVPEPAVDPQAADSADGGPAQIGELSPAVVWTLRYADGPHDAEALAVDPEGDAILVLAKRGSPASVYRAPFAPFDDAAPRVAEPIAAVRIPRPTARDFLEIGRLGVLRSQPTGLDLAPDGRGAVVLTYGDAFFFPRAAGTSWADAFAAVPERIPLPPIQQAEAIAWGDAGLLVSSEGAHAPLFRVPLSGEPRAPTPFRAEAAEPGAAPVE